MKILIVDDERHVREAIRLLVDWKTLGITEILEAANGQDAIGLIELVRPEIVVTDMMMPVRGGLDLLAWLQESRLPIQKIVISGHDDFHLVRGTMQYGGQDYLLKPIDPELLTEALLKAITLWEKNAQVRMEDIKRNMEINQLRPVMWDKIFSDLVVGSDQYANARSVLQDSFGLQVLERCQVAVLSLYPASAEVIEKYSRNRDLLFFTLTNICNEILRRGNRGLACRNVHGENEILIFYWEASGSPIAEVLKEINEGCMMTLRSPFDFGIGAWASFPKGTCFSYKTAQAALRERNMLKKNTHYFEYAPATSGERSSAPTIRFADEEEMFRLAILSGSERQIQDAVSRWIAEVQKLTTISWEQLELWRVEFDAMQTRWQKTLLSEAGQAAVGSRSVDGLEGDASFFETSSMPIPLGDEGCLSLERWEQALRASLAFWSRERGSKSQQNQSIIHDIARYVEQNYNKELTLQDIASHFYLSREYISRKFKQDIGENLIDYLCQIRIGKAKLLLENPLFKISQVAEMVGYSDEKYFSKVFKKLAGVSPNQYRKGERAE